MLNSKFAKLVAGVTLSFTLVASGSAVLPPKMAHVASVSAASKSSNIISTGKRYLGVPYKFGVSSYRTDRFDCSSFTQRIYRLNGINLPRTSKSQSKVGRYVSRSNLRPGDLVFFYKPIHHVGVYIGNGKVMHTYGKPGVTISNMKSGWWSKHYTTARRVL
ncbi:C40 family peptidase [Paenibacillus solisilvae]|uniref:C40 family peptidase n=1 Tax=Paenibacillus solisilvae TaxID=2486751 RepID=A0ABW0VVY0_9BACL